MARLLVINSSPAAEGSVSRRLTAALVARFSGKASDITYRDVGLEPPAHLDAETIGAFYTPADQLTPEQQQKTRLSDQLIAELEAADVIVIGSPMHNFTIAGGLKAYLDQVARVGRTFQYSPETGPVGLLADKKVYVLSSRGGNYSSRSPYAELNHESTYLQTVLGFIGLTDVTFIAAEDIKGGDDGINTALALIDSIEIA
ncbi:FMN-dependent NADH-azoreductase [Aliamphritea hakodatensis]|uniref:FMN-dependent NADH-azoreductase n=1 Tax=Aliamphritea hakodatensis TaxID=2895352 RepID=UPI0022FD7FC6|nr:NAD(P)H-dependent oxidoreductase [Aliamphritea hakodatensis]